MKLNLAIIHLDMVIETLSLEPGEYTIGRSSDNNIVVQHFSLEPVQGKIFFEEGQWFFQGQSNNRSFIINDGEVFKLSDQVGLATQAYVESGQTHVSQFSALRSEHQEMLNKRLTMVGGIVAVLLVLTVGGYQLFKSVPESVQQRKLISVVREKIVEFEYVRDDKAIDELKKYAGLEDADFKESSGFCTGFLVSPNIVLTAAHCLFGRLVIDMSNDFYLNASDGSQYPIKEVLGFDVKRDFLFLRTEGMEKYGHLDFAPGFEVEQKVYTVGNVHGEGIAIRDGIVSSLTADQDEPDVKFLRYSAGTSPGNSGGPLVNENGDVVALVFAATSSENFNLGTPSEDLLKAFNQFVSSPQPGQTINLALKRVLNFKPSMVLQSLALPYLPQFDEYPEASRAFNDIAIDVEVPIPFEKVDEIILQPLNKSVIQTYFEVQDILKKKNEIVLDWKSFVSDQTPAILPSQFDLSQNMFMKINNRYYPMVSGLIDSPSKADYLKYREQKKKENKFDFQSYGYNIEMTQEKFDLLGSDVFYKPKDNSGTKPRIQNLSYGAPYSQMVVYGDSDLRTEGFFGIKQVIKNFLGKNGVIANSVSRFTRPQSMKDFTINDFDLSDEAIERVDVQDGQGRKWVRSRIKIFEAVNIYTYCMELPEATFCIGRMLNIYNPVLLNIIEDNFRQFILSHLLINPYFWEKQALAEFISQGKAKDSFLMNGVHLKKKENQLFVDLDGFPLQMFIPEYSKIESVRIQTGLYGNSKEAEWSGYGIEWVQREGKKDLVCGAGLEVFQSQSTFVLNFLRDRRKQEKLRKIKGEDPKPLPGIWYKPFRGLKKPFQLYGYCAPLEEDPRVSDQYFVDFKNAKPLRYKYKIAQ